MKKIKDSLKSIIKKKTTIENLIFTKPDQASPN